jgi:hypothetical protein
MLSKLWAVIEVIKGLLHLFDFLRDKIRDRSSEKKETDLDKAVDDSKVAQTEEEFYDSQERIVDNK